MEATKLLIADGNEDFSLALQNALPDACEIRITQDGKEALDILSRFRPEVLVLDLMLPNLDGITLLQTAAAAGICPMVLATSVFVNAYVAQTLTDLGVGYVMIKPCDIQATVARIQDLSRHIHPSAAARDPGAQVVELLLSLNFNTKLDGYRFLKEAIVIIADAPQLSITKELYPAVAARCGTRASSVERSIRRAITCAWEHREDPLWQIYFPPDSRGMIPRPSNAKFITRIAQAISRP